MSEPSTAAAVEFDIPLADEQATLDLGRALAPCLEPGANLHFSGDLGAGKTTLTRGLLRGLGWEGRVKSPTYSLVELYVVSKLDLYHFDFYRFTDPEEWEAAGFRDLFNDRNICLVEWPEKAASLLPAADLSIRLTVSGQGRRARLSAPTPRGQRMLACLPPMPALPVSTSSAAS